MAQPRARWVLHEVRILAAGELPGPTLFVENRLSDDGTSEALVPTDPMQTGAGATFQHSAPQPLFDHRTGVACAVARRLPRHVGQGNDYRSRSSAPADVDSVGIYPTPISDGKTPRRGPDKSGEDYTFLSSERAALSHQLRRKRWFHIS